MLIVFWLWHKRCSVVSQSHKAEMNDREWIMKNFFMFLSLIAVSTLSMGAYADERESHETIVSVNDVYVPSGFDSSSESFVVVSGLFPSTCYKLKGATVSHIGPALHEVRTNAWVIDGTCLMVLVPFHKEVQLGKLSKGDHTLRFVNGDKTYMDKHLVIEQ